MNAPLTMPLFVFQRRRHAEIEGGFTLAGQLVIDLPKQPNREGQQIVAHIIRLLTDEAKSGRMPHDGLVVAWRGGRKPPNAADVYDDALMSAWVKDRLVVAVRIDPRDDGRIRFDSDVLRQMNGDIASNERSRS
jgi:hypothetical protein